MRIPRNIKIHNGEAYHFIWRMHNKEFRLKTNKNKLIYLRSVFNDFKKNLKHSPFLIFGYCIMSNHIHRIDKLLSSASSLSNHMRRAHSNFGRKINHLEKRSGSVGNERPNTIPIEDIHGQMRVLFYILTNPVRAGICRDPMSILLKTCSSCRFFAFGETNEFSSMVTFPQWYLDLGKTPKARQAKFRSLLNKYLEEQGLKRDSKISDGLYIGSKQWAEKMLQEAREYRASCKIPPVGGLGRGRPVCCVATP